MKSATVHKLYPDTLAITLEERKAKLSRLKEAVAARADAIVAAVLEDTRKPEGEDVTLGELFHHIAAGGQQHAFGDFDHHGVTGQRMLKQVLLPPLLASSTVGCTARAGPGAWWTMKPSQ